MAAKSIFGFCSLLRKVRVPLHFSKNSAFTFIYDSGLSVVVSLDCCVGSIRRRCSSVPSILSTVLVRSNLTNNMSEVKHFQRLPKNVVPKHYALTLTPNLKTFIFDGEVFIDIEVNTLTDSIVLNSLDLSVKDVTITSSDGTSISPEKTNISVDEETAEFYFPQSVPVGNHTLNIKFTGEINDKMKGFYRSKYLSPSGEERFAAVTQFEATDARRCFPCWDEPAIKATFDINLIVPPKLESLSNMPVKSTKEMGDLICYEFERTPIMSTYLVAAVVGEYDYVEDMSTDGVLVRVYTPRGKREQGLFALEVATKVLPYYKDYFNIAYPLPKIDLIAIADFSSGAMENWGLVTYRETCLLVDSQHTSAVRKQWIALVVGHELAHQWFGNLVTMEWWTHLWLNEGYASFVEFLCVHHLFPEYDIWTQFVTDMYIRALELDCLDNSHPIEVPVGHPSEIDEIFDDISYNKGASVIRMLHNYIGDDDFRKGMNLYLTKHQYKNTSTEDLWAALEEASKKPVGTVMSTWIKRMGFPVVTVSSKPTADGKGLDLTLTQSKFSSATDCKKSDDKDLWMIPISVSTSQNPSELAANIVLKSQHTTISLPNVSLNDWVKINPGAVGFYRTQYPSDLLSRLIPAIQDKTLPPLDRLGLVDDLFAMVQAGHTSTVEVLKLMQAFSQEDNYTVWSSIANCLSKLSILLTHTEETYENAFKAYERRLLANISKRLGWDPLTGDTHLDTLCRSLVIGRLVWLDDTDTVSEAQRRFKCHIGDGPTISADLRNACYKAVLRAGDKSTYEEMLQLYRSVDLQEEKNRISQALGAIRDKEILAKVLEFAMSEDVRSQDSVFVIISVAMGRTGRIMAWQFLKDNWAELTNRYQGGFLFARLVKFTTENFASEDMAQDIEAFFKEHKSPGTERTVQQSIESVRRNAAWLKRDAEAIKAFLGSQI